MKKGMSRDAGRSIPACETIVDKKITKSPEPRAARYRDFPHFSSDLHTIKKQIKNTKIIISDFFRVNNSRECCHVTLIGEIIVFPIDFIQAFRTVPV